MSRIRGLELLYNLEKKNFKSKEDCLLVALHCLLINENFECKGTGDDWPETDSNTTELLPENWNSNQDVYSLRYGCKNNSNRILIKSTKMEHLLQIDIVKNEAVVGNIAVPVTKYVSDDYQQYSTAYKELESLVEAFRKEIIEKLKDPEPEEGKKKPSLPPRSSPVPNPETPPRPSRSPFDVEDPRDPFPPQLPRIGGNDLNPFGGSARGGGMFMDPSSFGVPARPTLPQFGVGGPGGLPRGAVPPGARFDPFMPPIRSDRRRNPNSDEFPPPDFEDQFM